MNVKTVLKVGPWSRAAFLVGTLLAGLPRAEAASYTVKSPDGTISLSVTQDPEDGTLTYQVQSGGATLLDRGTLGIATNRGDFASGLRLVGQSRTVVKETYRLPAGKRSTYLNHANELELAFRKGKGQMRLHLRAYDDGIAFRYAIPGSGAIEIAGETTSFPLSGSDVTYWGQAHPNNFGYESALGPVTAERLSMPVLVELRDSRHFLFIAQAASYGSYIIPNYKRQANELSVSFPMDQREPVKTTLPFRSPWRVVIVSADNLGKIVESSLLENLNPPTEPRLRNAGWIRPGRASWDFLAGDGANLRTWVDFDVQMGWEYHVADAGWERRVPDMAEVTAYARSKKVGIVAWGKVANRHNLYQRESAEAWMANLAKLGISGAKIDFFDQREVSAEKTDDLEDTQQRLIVRDFLTEIAAKHRLLLEYHGCAIPSGERRRWPHLMSAEAVYGLERRTQNLQHDLTIPYVRNIMGPVSFTPFHLTRSIGSLAYQLGQGVIYEAGIQIFAERHDRILAFSGVEFLKALPAAWDDVEFIEGLPGSHAIFARRKIRDWFVGGITGQARTARIPLTFLQPGVVYRADLYRDGQAKTALIAEQKSLGSQDTLEVAMLAAGGFALHLRHP
jgi:alpha-glucosidase